MNFIDKVRIHLKAGDGGDGCLSFRREKFLEFGGPNGGDGGRGGAIYLEASPSVTTLLHLAHRPHLKGESGSRGKSYNKSGDSGADVVVPVPVGTVVYREGVLVADLTEPKQRFLAAEGGRGGRGNLSFKTQRNTAPRLYERGAPGEKITYDVELKLLADVGFVGFPNAGKSSLLARITAARPKVADYPFTTLSPNLGVARHKHVDFVAADIPGLIEGAHDGKGLGGDFLRHIERTRLLVHLVDPAGYGGSDALPGIKVIEQELKSFSPRLAAKPRILVVNKMDLPGADKVLRQVRGRYRARVLSISAATGEGVHELLDRILLELSRADASAGFTEKAVDAKLLKVDRGFEVVPMGGGRYQLKGQFVTRAATMLDPTLPEAVDRFQRTLKRIGVDRALKRAGVQEGDAIVCGEFEFSWSDAPYKALKKLRRADTRTRIGVGKR